MCSFWRFVNVDRPVGIPIPLESLIRSRQAFGRLAERFCAFEKATSVVRAVAVHGRDSRRARLRHQNDGLHHRRPEDVLPLVWPR